MVRILILIVVSGMLGCGTTNRAKRAANKEGSSYNPDKDFSIVVDTVIKNQDTFYTAELRIYKIKSALDGMNMMYKNYGEWSGEREGKYQENISQLVWIDVDLNADGRKYVVIADGTETMTKYFVSLIIFDANTKNCFQYDYPEKQEILNLVMEKMDNLYPLDENVQDIEPEWRIINKKK